MRTKKFSERSEKPLEDNSLGIYIHIPFCKTKCSYCNFYSLCSGDADALNNYTDCVCERICKWGSTLNKTVDTIYFGGGTPSLIGAENVSKILGAIRANFKVDSKETTIEVNPGDYSILDFKKLKACGIDRVSIGVQSTEAGELKILGRRHSIEEVMRTISALKGADIKNFSVDFILGTPTQTLSTLDKFMNFCTANQIPHVSAYLLKLEENTPLYINKSRYRFLSEEESGQFYEYFSNGMKDRGYGHYEISNFALPGFESKHNLKYWNLSDYLGIGPSAHSMVNKKRFYYSDNLNDFIDKGFYTSDGLGGSEEEYVMLKLRLREGLRSGEYKLRFGKNIPEKYFEKAKMFQKMGLVEIEGDSFALTTKGFLVSNRIICEFLY